MAGYFRQPRLQVPPVAVPNSAPARSRRRRSLRRKVRVPIRVAQTFQFKIVPTPKTQRLAAWASRSSHPPIPPSTRTAVDGRNVALLSSIHLVSYLLAGAKNVLYILVDDLRPSLSPYGQTQVHTPNIQKLADGATTFLRAYCQEAVCSPSRNSFVSGRRPDHTRAWNFINVRHFLAYLSFPARAERCAQFEFAGVFSTSAKQTLAWSWPTPLSPAPRSPPSTSA